MGFVDEDIYAFAAGELLTMPRTTLKTFWPFARKLWLAFVVLATYALQMALFILVLRAQGLGGGSVSSRDLMQLLNDTRSNIYTLNTYQPCWTRDTSGNMAPVEVIEQCQAKLTPPEGLPQQPPNSTQQQWALDTVGRILEAEARAVYIKWFGQDYYRASELTAVAVAFALVVLALCVHQEMVRSAVLARVVLTHTGLMPGFYAPMWISPVREDSNGQMVDVEVAPVTIFVRVLLLLLPAMQLSSCLCALTAASVAFLSDAESSDIVSVILNSAALLFTLEFDNIVCAIIRELEPCNRTGSGETHTSSPTIKLSYTKPRNKSIVSAIKAAKNSCVRRLGYIYIALFGSAFFSAPYFTLLPSYTPSAAVSNSGEIICTGFGSIVSSSLKASITFLVMYFVLMALLFDAPILPAVKPKSCTFPPDLAWRVYHKVAILAVIAPMITLLFILEPYRTRGSCVRTRAEKVAGYVFIWALPVVNLACMYVIWPVVAGLADARRSKRDASADASKGVDDEL